MADAWPLLYVYSLSQPNIREAIKPRSELVEALFKGAVRPTEAEVVELYNQLIAPSIEEVQAVAEPSESFKKQLARLGYRKGKILDEYSAIGVPGDRKAEIYQSYNLAVAGDPHNAEYLALPADFPGSSSSLPRWKPGWPMPRLWSA